MKKTIVPKITIEKDSNGNIKRAVAKFPGIASKEICDEQFLNYIRLGSEIIQEDVDSGENTAASGYIEIGPDSGTSVSGTGEDWNSTVTDFHGFPEELRLGPGIYDIYEPDECDFEELKRLKEIQESNGDSVNHPKHYNSHPSGVECIDIARHYDFNIGNAIKYLWRHGLKSEEGMDDTEKSIEDLKKAIWYLNKLIDSISE